MTVQASKPFSGSQWSEVESLSARDARRLQDQRLREQLAYLAARSDFYRAKFAEHGVDPGTGERVRSALNFKTVVELVPEGTLKRPDHVKVALIERVHG